MLKLPPVFPVDASVSAEVEKEGKEEEKGGGVNREKTVPHTWQLLYFSSWRIS